MPIIDGKPQTTPPGFDVPAEVPPRNRELAILVCTGALKLRKERGLQSVSPSDLANQTDQRPSEVGLGITQAVELGWLARRDDHVALTASGIYVAKQALNLPR